MTPLTIVIPGNFDRGKNFRRRTTDLAWAALQAIPKEEWKHWPTKHVVAKIFSTNTLSTRREARLLLKMMQGVIWTHDAKIAEHHFVEGEEWATGISVTIERKTYENTR